MRFVVCGSLCVIVRCVLFVVDVSLLRVGWWLLRFWCVLLAVAWWSVFVASCSLCVVCRFGVRLACVDCRINGCRLLFVVCCVLSGRCACRLCVVFVVRPLLSDVTWLLFVVCCLMLLFLFVVAFCLTFVVCCL